MNRTLYIPTEIYELAKIKASIKGLSVSAYFAELVKTDKVSETDINKHLENIKRTLGVE